MENWYSLPAATRWYAGSGPWTTPGSVNGLSM